MYTIAGVNYNVLMLIGGGEAVNDVELVDLSGQLRTCDKPSNVPVNMDWGQEGAFFDGQAIVCGGFDGGHVNLEQSSCFKYVHQVIYIQTNLG